MASQAAAGVGRLTRPRVAAPGLDPDLLLKAYSVGLFPMAESRGVDEVFWVEPKRRGVLPLDRFHLARTLARTLRRERFALTADRAFAAVVAACGEPAPGREESWINPPIAHAVTELHRRGVAHSLECWDGERRLVGGLYGVALGAAFFGESMFSRATDGSKVALAHLVARLRAGGFRLLDTQFLTGHLARFGAVEVTRDVYKRQLTAALGSSGDWSALDRLAERDFGRETAISGYRIEQLLAHTS